MGKSANGQEIAKSVVSGIFEATGQSGNAVRGLQSTGGSSSIDPVFGGMLNASLLGTFEATVRLEKSYDGGVTWNPLSRDVTGTPAEYTTPVEFGVFEPEDAVEYRWNCTSYTSGTVNYRLSQ